MKQRPARGYARVAILNATLDIIASDGIDAVTHRRIAEAAGVSPGSTTHHFASREDLIREAFRFYLQMASRFMTALDEEVHESVDDPLDRVRRWASEIIRREFEHPGEQRVRAEHEMLLYATTDAELAALVRDWDKRWVSHIVGDLEAAGWDRPVLTARTIINLIRGYELERLINPAQELAEFESRLESVLSRNRY